MPDIDITVVREKSGGIRCIYIGRYRVIGQKPYVSENLPQQVYPVPVSMIEDALALAHNEAIEAEHDVDALDGKEGAGSHVLVQSLRETATCDGEHRWSKCLREAADAIEYWAARSDAFEKEYEQLKARVRNLAGS